MTDLQISLTVGVFAGVILLIALDLIDMAVAALLGVCILPNATAVILVAPVIVRVAQSLKVDFVGPMILAAVVSNSAGMLTLVGDPATFLVGSAIGLSFGDYLRMVSLGACLRCWSFFPCCRG